MYTGLADAPAAAPAGGTTTIRLPVLEQEESVLCPLGPLWEPDGNGNFVQTKSWSPPATVEDNLSAENR